MWSLRVFRFSLLGLLLLLAAFLLLDLDPPPRVPPPSPDAEPKEGSRAENVRVIELNGAIRSLVADADLVEPGDDGQLHFEGLRRVEIDREDRHPLIVSAAEGDVHGQPGARRWTLDEQVTIQDPEDDLELKLPSLSIDEGAGKARSRGDIRYRGPGFHGNASALTYDLGGGPTELDEPDVQSDAGDRVTAERALLLDGLRDVELIGDVRATGNDGRIDAARLRLIHGPDDRPQRAMASGGVTGEYALRDGGRVSIAADELETWWDDDGRVRRGLLEDEASIERGGDRLRAGTIDTERDLGGGWSVDARHGVVLEGNLVAGAARLDTEELTARLGDDLVVRVARARNGVRFRTADTLAEADRATFVADSGGGMIELFAGDSRKARLARERTRVAADRIRTDPAGRELAAEGRVEATLLGEDAAAATRSLFATEAAIHFVSSRLDGKDSGTRLTFRGSVRAWQEERSLAAETVVLDQNAGTLVAERRVATRVPRVTEDAAGETDYVLVTAERLFYEEASRIAHYSGSVRIGMVEGWMEADDVDVHLGESGGGIELVRATSEVRLELRPGEEKEPVRGESDELVYRPAEETVVLMGHEAPATIRQAGGTTLGRVLTYRLDDGTLEVEAGGSSTARTQPDEGDGLEAAPPSEPE